MSQHDRKSDCFDKGTAKAVMLEVEKLVLLHVTTDRLMRGNMQTVLPYCSCNCPWFNFSYKCESVAAKLTTFQAVRNCLSLNACKFLMLKNMASSQMLLGFNYATGVYTFCWDLLMLTNFILQQATKAQRMSRGIVVLVFLYL
jgi:hypothetical protein